MKVIIFQLVLTLLILDTYAQKVSNIRAEQRGQEIVVLYSLETNSPCEVSLLLSQDNGVTWGSPLKNVSGDVGKNVSAGEKQITWKVLEEQEHLLGDNIKFKVIASGTETFEPEMIFVEGGTFQMGNNLGDSDEKPIHSVTLKNYYIGKYEITRAQWVAIMGYKPNFGRVCDNCPVDAVSWNDIHKYVLKLNSITGKGYRLPTEAEWEYAARGGRQDKGNSYMSSSGLSSLAWFNENSSGITHEVGSRLANELGIYDMLGNVSEWCSDWYGNYKNIEVSNPKGPVKGTYRVLRGGSWSDSERNCRETDRYWMNSDDRYVFCGFRLVLPVE
jgi:formylglycine-generating enzyme required for sulfatase activity